MMETAALKLLLIYLALLALAALLTLVVFFMLGWLLRELILSWRVRRSTRKTFHHPRPIDREYSIKDSPAWDRWENPTKPGRAMRVAAELRRLGR